MAVWFRNARDFKKDPNCSKYIRTRMLKTGKIPKFLMEYGFPIKEQIQKIMISYQIFKNLLKEKISHKFMMNIQIKVKMDSQKMIMKWKFLIKRQFILN